MTTPNRSLIEKADLALSNLQTDGGLLADQQADRFIRLMIKQSQLLQQVTVTPMRGPREERNKLRFAGRVLRPASPGVALPENERRKPDLSSYTLDVEEFKADVRLNDSVMEDNIERGTFGDTVMEAMTEAVARDVEFVGIQGDTASADVLLAKLDGYLKQATSNVVNVGSVNLTKDPLKNMLKSLPDEFARSTNLRYYTNRQARIDYQDSLANRATALGDQTLATAPTVFFQGMAVESVDEFPDSGTTQALLTDPANLTVGFHRDIRFETDRDVAAGVNLIVATVRFDVKIQEVTAVSKGINITTS